MELDDQLAALAAGELDAADARALQARAAADPALAARLARFEQLHAVLTGWDAPALSDDAVARLDAVLDAALAELGDAPLTEVLPARGAGLRALRDDDRSEPAAVAAASVPSDDGVVDLAAARAARGVPSWVAGLGIAAALVAVVGIGANVAGLGSAQDTADSVASDLAEESTADSADESDDSTMANEAPADDSFDAPAAGNDDGAAGSTEAAELAPRRQTGIVIAAGDLLSLVAPETADAAADAETTEDDASSDGALTTCIDEALGRDSDPNSERVVDLLATGTYADADAVFVVLRTLQPDGDTLTVLAYDPAGCTLLDTAGTTG